MNSKLIEILVCPCCKAKIEVLECKKRNQEILDGVLRCTECQKTYPICNGIPDLGPPNLVNNDNISRGDKSSDVKRANIVFHDAIAKDYESDTSTFDLFKPYTQSRVAELLNYISNTTEANLLLDLGCGTGNLLLAGRNYFEEVIGVDISKEMLSVARDRKFEVVCADVESVPLVDEVADCVACFSVLHHLYEPVGVFREAYRLLKVGGIFYSDYDPNRSSKLLQDSWLFSLGKKIFRKLFCWRKESAELLGLVEVQEIAEYHQNVEAGLDPFSLKTQLEEIGFTNITIIQHSNCSSLKKNTFWHIPLVYKIEMVIKFLVSWRLSYSDLASQFLILARK